MRGRGQIAAQTNIIAAPGAVTYIQLDVTKSPRLEQERESQ
jgi:hypothetical protein